MMISGDSLGAGEVSIKKIDGFSVNLTGKYNTLLLVYKDVPNMISRVTNSIHVNIASFYCDRSAKVKKPLCAFALTAISAKKSLIFWD